MKDPEISGDLRRGAPITAQFYVHQAYLWMKLVQRELEDVRSSLDLAHELAVLYRQPTMQIVELHGDLQALHELLRDRIKDLMRKLTEVAAGSRDDVH